MLDAEFPCVPSAIPGERVEELLINNGCLKTADHRGISQCRSRIRHGHVAGDKSCRDAVTGNCECRKRRSARPRRSELRSQMVARARGEIEKLASQVAVTELIRHAAAEGMCV